MSDVVAAKMTSVEVDRGVSGVQIGDRSKKDVSPLEEVGHRYFFDCTIKKLTFFSDKHLSDLDVNLEHFRVKLTYTFLHFIDHQHGIYL